MRGPPVIAGIVLGVAGLLVADQILAAWSPVSEETVRWEDRFPDVLLTTHEGETVRFHEDLVEGKIVAINFMYCGCTKF